MKYFKNTELAKLYNVSEKSVRNWIDAAKAGKLELQLHQEGEKSFIANTSKNTLVLDPLVQRGKKYRNSRGYKVVTPTQEFYELYSAKQILDIIANIDVHREIPYQYNYFDGGAEHWDRYTQRLIDENIPSYQGTTIAQLDINKAYIDELLSSYSKVNVIDIGTGNALPVKGLIERLHAQGKLKRYIGVDISPDMLRIARRNVVAWLGGDTHYEGHIKDISYDRFDDLLASELFIQEAEKTINVVTLFGGTIYNLREPDRALHTIYDSMGKNDLLISDYKLDSEVSRRYFDFASDPKYPMPQFRGKAMLDLLGIDEQFYQVEQFFDESKKARFARVRLEVALSLELQLDEGVGVVELNKGDRILLWRSWHQSAIKTLRQFDDNNFELLLCSRSSDQDYLLTISRIKTNT